MIISPPFIPEITPGQDESIFLENAFDQGEFGNGAFPLSYDLNWHGGVHLRAPVEGSGFCKVRAVADGTLAYFRQPQAHSDDKQHPLRYQNEWTDNGCIILRHETEIGEGPECQVVYYSIYMHLSAIDLANPVQGMKVFRKDILGDAGSVYGDLHKIHFEIIASDDQIAKLTGRTTPDVDLPDSNGRTDSCWGDIHFHIPTGTSFYTARPADPRSTLNTSPIVGGALAPTFLTMSYALGRCNLSTCDEPENFSCSREAENYEYDLYQTALREYPDSPSAGYELLRFGRILGPDALQPEDAAHWRQVSTPEVTGWVNLNVPAIGKFSDADFPHWEGWQLISDDTDGSSHCQSERIRTLLNIPSDVANDVEGRRIGERNLSDIEVQESVARVICRFPTEWARDHFDQRYGWILETGQMEPAPYDALRKHIDALAFWEEAGLTDIGSEHWHFPPKEFIAAFRKCGWLSESEMTQLVPKHALRNAGRNLGYVWEPIRLNSSKVLKHQKDPLNKMLRKYGINTSRRMSCFFGNSIQETQWLSTLAEVGGSRLWYAPWQGRGFLQLTSPSNYVDYWLYRGRIISSVLRRELVAAYNAIYRSPAAGRTNSTLQDRNFSSLSRLMIDWRNEVGGGDAAPINSEAEFAPSDSAGYYWISCRMAYHADIEHVLERQSVSSDVGERVYYRSPSFWAASASVNLPAAINNYYRGLNGFEPRCSAYGVSLAVLGENKFPSATGRRTLDYPENYEPRR